MAFNYKSDSSYEMWALAHTDPVQSKTGRFMTLSVLFHIGLVAAALVASPFVDTTKKEVITIEIADPVRQLPRGVVVPVATEGAPAVQETHAAVKKSAASKVAPAPKASVAKSAHKASPTKAASVPQQQIATIDDIEAPSIDQALEAPANETLDENFADQDFSEIDQEQNQKVLAEKNRLASQAQALEEENEESLSELNDENLAEAEAIKQANQERRARDAKAIAAAAQGEREAAAKKAALAAAEARKNALGKKGAGAGAQGSRQAGSHAGTPNGVRSLDQLRQMPGNRGPQYSREERRNREQGVVSFLAYVTKEGRLAKFKQVSSTRHQGLDQKTLAALQKWKFYPGQEGWVELPFKWDLKGEPQALDGLLRGRRNDISQR